MRWLILTNFPPKMGGLQSRTLVLAEELLKRDFEVHVWCIGANLFRELENKYKKLWVTKIDVQDTRKFFFSEVLFYYKRFKQLEFDAMFFCVPGVPEFFNFIFAAKLAKIKHIIMHVGAWPVMINNHSVDKLSLLKGIGRWWWRFYIQAWLSMKCVTLSLFNNEEQLKRFEYLYSPYFSKKALWWPPVNLKRFKPNLKLREKYRKLLGINNDFLYGSIGTLCKQKRQDLIIKAFSLIKTKIKNSKLLIVGDGEEAQSLHELAFQLNLEKHIIFTGERNDVEGFLNCMDVFVFSSDDYNETLGIAILEAMACGIPCIVGDIPGPLRIAGDRYALVFKSGDVEDLSKKMLELYKNSNLRKQLSLLGLERAKVCNAKYVVDYLLDLIRS